MSNGALQPGFIARAPLLPRSQDFAFLRARGLRHVERLAHAHWTDYNVHDPGITILELACFGITDLGLRAAYPMRDLLAPPPLGSATPAPRDFHLAHEILVSDPVSFDDLRRVLIDIPGVRNAWVERHRGIQYGVDRPHRTLVPAGVPAATETIEVKGLLDVYLEYEEFVTGPSPRVAKSEVRAAALERIHLARNLCQDVVNVCDLVGEDVAICADIELRADADAEAVHAEILYQVGRHISPSVPFHSLEEMLARGRTVDEIFDGPPLTHGFIDADELRAIRRKCEIRASDIFQILMDVDGVVAVKNLTLLRLSTPVQMEDWILPLSEDRFRIAVFNAEKSKLIFYKRDLPYYANRKRVQALFDQKKTLDIEAKLRVAEARLEVPAGVWRDVASYEPLQNELPGTYLVGRTRVPDTDPVRQAQSRQLRAYLLFFDQLLANSLAQLSHLGDLFTWREVGVTTYFTQQIPGIPDFADLDNAVARGHSSFEQGLQQIAETPAMAEGRRLGFLEHLAARFAEEFDEYSALMRALPLEATSPGTPGGVGGRLITQKRGFLHEYPLISRARGTGFDWRKPGTAANVSGYQRRLYRLLDISPVARRQLAGHRFDIVDTGSSSTGPEWRFRLKRADGSIIFRSISCHTRSAIEAVLDLALRLGGDRSNYDPPGAAAEYRLVQHCPEDPAPDALTEAIPAADLADAIAYFKEYAASEGFHVIEHVLLRRRTEADPFLPVQLEAEDACCPPVHDPYSFRISVVLPSWSPRFRDLRFRHLVEDMLRREAPAHVYPRICWVNHAQMQDLEVTLEDWQTRLAAIATDAAICDATETRTRTGRLPLVPLAAASPSDRDYTASLKRLIDRLYRLTNVYPLAQLHDCEEVDGNTPQVTLGRTSLGTL